MSYNEQQKPLIIDILPFSSVNFNLKGKAEGDKEKMALEEARQLRFRNFILLTDNEGDAERVWLRIIGILSKKGLIVTKEDADLDPPYTSTITNAAVPGETKIGIVLGGKALTPQGDKVAIGIEDILANCLSVNYAESESTQTRESKSGAAVHDNEDHTTAHRIEAERPLFSTLDICKFMRLHFTVVDDPEHKVRISGVTGNLRKEGYEYPALSLLWFEDEKQCSLVHRKLQAEELALRKLEMPWVPAFHEETDRTGHGILVNREPKKMLHALMAAGFSHDEVQALEKQIERATLDYTTKEINRDLENLHKQQERGGGPSL